jgi:hypothetical protein
MRLKIVLILLLVTVLIGTCCTNNKHNVNLEDTIVEREVDDTIQVPTRDTIIVYV